MLTQPYGLYPFAAPPALLSTVPPLTPRVPAYSYSPNVYYWPAYPSPPVSPSAYYNGLTTPVTSGPSPPALVRMRGLPYSSSKIDILKFFEGFEVRGLSGYGFSFNRAAAAAELGSRPADALPATPSESVSLLT